MINTVLIYIAAISLLLWGIVHIIPVRSVVKGFGEISPDNKRIITMEWINEGLTLIFISLLLIAVTLYGNPSSLLQKAICILSACMLLAMSVLSLFTGFRVHFLPYRLCPFIFAGSAVLIILGLII